MGFGITNIVNKFTTPALISWSGGNIKVDVKISEQHRYSNDVTEQTMENGTIIDEHVINKPIEISIEFEETNGGSILTGRILSQSKILSVFEKLVQLWESKELLTITTKHKMYEDMVLKNMPISHRAPFRNTIRVTIELIQLNFSVLETTEYKAIEKSINMAASNNVSGGTVKTSNA